MSEIAAAMGFITETKSGQPRADKAWIQQAFLDRFKPRRERSLFVGDGYSMRFSHTTGAGFSNTVLALSALRDVDDRPFGCLRLTRDLERVLASDYVPSVDVAYAERFMNDLLAM